MKPILGFTGLLLVAVLVTPLSGPARAEVSTKTERHRCNEPDSRAVQLEDIDVSGLYAPRAIEKGVEADFDIVLEIGADGQVTQVRYAYVAMWFDGTRGKTVHRSGNTGFAQARHSIGAAVPDELKTELLGAWTTILTPTIMHLPFRPARHQCANVAGSLNMPRIQFRFHNL